jgi:hypothetical protein
MPANITVVVPAGVNVQASSRTVQQQQQQQLSAHLEGMLLLQPQQTYNESWQRSRDVMTRNWQAATNAQRNMQWQQLDSWSQQQLGKPALLCTPDDLLVYLESSFTREHGRQVAADGSRCAAPSTVSNAVSHLSTRFQELGRRGPWDRSTGRGNPCDSMELRTFKGGYANIMQEQGFQQASAKPISEAKLQQLVGQLVEEADCYQQLTPQQQQQPWHVEALLRRDACIAQYLWGSKRRPAETGQLQSAQVEVNLSASSGGQVVTQPSVSKMCHASHSSRRPRPVEVQGAAGQQLATLLLQYQQCLQRSGRSIGTFFFSPLQSNRLDLQQDQGLSIAAMEQRVIGHLKRLHLYEGETLYSIKRGAMQHAVHVCGVSLQAVGEAADIETPAVVATYVDPYRHVR